MVICNRETVNINSFFYKSAMSHSLKINVNMDKPKGRSRSSSQNSLRESLVQPNLSSILYMNRIETQNNDLSWAKQTKKKNFQLLYITPR